MITWTPISTICHQNKNNQMEHLRVIIPREDAKDKIKVTLQTALDLEIISKQEYDAIDPCHS